MTRTDRILIFAMLILILVVAVGLFLKLSEPNSGNSGQQKGQTKQIQGTLSLPQGLFGQQISQPQQVEILLTLPSDEPSSDSATFLPLLFTGLFTLLGSSLGFLYSYVSENSARKFEWGKHLWDMYQSQYLELRDTIRKSIDARVIEAQLQSFAGKVIFPSELEKSLDGLLRYLKQEYADEEKQNKRDEFLSMFDKFAARPWDFF